MLNKLPNYLIIKILNYLDHEGLMKIYEIDKYKDLIKNNVWKNITIKLVKKKRIQKFIDSGWINCFIKYDLRQSEIDNNLLQYFSHCDNLNLYNCNKLEPGFTKYIENCHTVNLSKCNISNDDIKYLSNCKKLDITDCNIIDEDLRLLENVESLDISYCKNITLKGIQYLKNIQVLNVEMCMSLIHEIRNIYNSEYVEYFEKYYPHIKLMRSIPMSKLEPWERDEF